MLDRTHRLRRAGVIVTIAAFSAILASCGDSTGPNNRQNALRPEGKEAHKILDLTRPFFWIAVAIGLFVLAGTVYVAVRFRERAGDGVGPKQVHGNTALEVSWTIIPAVILLVMAVPTVATVFDLAKKPTGRDVVHVTVVAKQWWWEYHYTDDKLVTANEMHVPVGRPVSLTLQGPSDGSGVIHSFWVPSLSGKKDVVPGRSHFLKFTAERTGTYLGQCAEYCGLSHANMRLRVIVQSDSDYRRWVQAQKQPLAASTKDFLDKTNKAWACSNCHSFDPTKPGVVAPNLTHVGDREAFAGDIFPMTLDELTAWVYDAPGRKPMGKLFQHMPAFKDAGMTKRQAAEIARFLLCDTRTDPREHAEVCQ